MKRSEMGERLNVVLEAIDNIQDALPPHLRRPRERIATIRDQVVLLALDLGLPVKPIQQEQPKPAEVKTDAEDDGSPGQTG